MPLSKIARIHRIAAEQQRLLACQTCGACFAPFVCAWRCDVPSAVSPARVEVGDVVVTPQTKRHAHVVHVNRVHEAGRPLTLIVVEITVEYRHGRRKPPYPRRTYMRRPHGHVTVLRPGVCGARCCEAHVREAGEGVGYCRAHWNSWREV